MTSFFGKLRSTGQAGAVAGSPAKKDPNAPPPLPLEKLLADAGPMRTDGSDKFFGFENFGSTCYCNSIIQCLYYSQPFREQVINFPARSPAEPLKRKLAAGQLAADRALLAAKNSSANAQNTTSPRSKQPPPNPVTGQQQKAEENKDSPEYKKKVALTTGPLLKLDFENAKAYGMAESLFTSLKDIFEAVIAHDSRMGIVSPHKFLEILRRDNEMFRTPMHQDAHEFLNLLLNQVVENVEQYSKENEMNGKVIGEEGSSDALSRAVSVVQNSLTASNAHPGVNMSSRWVHELFEGTLTSETRCLTCETISQRDEAFLDLSVDLENHNSVTSCLRRFSEEEMLCERNKFHCDRCCGLQEAEKRMKIKRLPRILALHLKRFKYTEDMQRLQKLFHRVVYPYYLRLFNTTDDAEDPDRLYELYAVVVHIGGGPYHGHYVSIIKTQDRGWLLFDDEMVEPVDKRFVTKFFGEGIDVLGHPKNLACAYVLFYQETTEEAMQRELDSEGVPVAAMSADAQGDPLSVKTNGATLNGGVHQPVPGTPKSETSDHFANLDHAMTAPVGGPIPPLSNIPFANPLEPTPSSPNLPFLKRKKSQSEFMAKEEQKRLGKEQVRLDKQEKERRKAEEKEAEKQAKLKKKADEAAKKEGTRRQEEELAHRYRNAGLTRSTTAPMTGYTSTAYTDTTASSSNTSSRIGDEESTMSPTTTNPGSRPSGLGLATGEREFQSPTSNPSQNGTPNSIASTAALSPNNASNMLHRFRNTSMSLRQKPRFWSKEKEKTRRSEDAQSSSVRAGEGRPVTPEEQLNESLLGNGSPAGTYDQHLHQQQQQDGKRKESLFGLGRKKSVNLLSRNH